jgi:tetratricopeptide (TPR) repeat protein
MTDIKKSTFEKKFFFLYNNLPEVNVKVKWVPILLIIAVFIGCSAKKSYRSEFDFANKMAQEGLWKEALYRWEKALAEGKESAAVYNNIAVALEEMGKLEEAEKTYKKALELAPNNPTIKGNLDKLKKFLKKGRKEGEDDEDKEKK